MLFLDEFLSDRVLQAGQVESHIGTLKYPDVFDFAERKKCRSLASIGLFILHRCDPEVTAGKRACRQRPICHLNLTPYGGTKSSMRRDVSCIRTSILNGKNPI
jgi:hypothetical protein